MKLPKYFGVTLLVVLVDQVSKYLVKINMYPGEEKVLVKNFLKLRFEENNGFAFGLEFTDLFARLNIHMTPETGKLILTFFSIFAVFALGVLLFRFSDHRSPMPLILAIIFGGALGNIIDRTFYGWIFSAINFYEGGIFHGRVVDMIFFDLGNNGSFVPIFNLADMAISAGILIILIFQGRFTRMHEQALVKS
ncbi:MAG: signal peptidase II [Bacteroidia bacterium]|nr:signal peptidase II [Bacteroidia bacterium]